jgi:uncharacterized damage-inducible protein DinB
MMLPQQLAAILRRDLEALRREIEAYPDEALIWQRPQGLPNSAGMLVRHLCGNLRHYLGAVLGGSGYRRDRAAEFAAPPSDRAALLAELDRTERVVGSVLSGLPDQRLAGRYPEAVAGQELDTGDFLLHLAAHCAFHLGQVDYHRRTVTGSADSVSPMAIPELSSARPGAPARPRPG